jgi:hypothetical protein
MIPALAYNLLRRISLSRRARTTRSGLHEILSAIEGEVQKRSLSRMRSLAAREEIPAAIDKARYLGLNQFKVLRPFDVTWDAPGSQPASTQPFTVELDPDSKEKALGCPEDDWEGIARSGSTSTCQWLYKTSPWIRAARSCLAARRRCRTRTWSSPNSMAALPPQRLTPRNTACPDCFSRTGKHTSSSGTEVVSSGIRIA